jgi:hypothetical protein
MLLVWSGRRSEYYTIDAVVGNPVVNRDCEQPELVKSRSRNVDRETRWISIVLEEIRPPT